MTHALSPTRAFPHTRARRRIKQQPSTRQYLVPLDSANVLRHKTTHECLSHHLAKRRLNDVAAMTETVQPHTERQFPAPQRCQTVTERTESQNGAWVAREGAYLKGCSFLAASLSGLWKHFRRKHFHNVYTRTYSFSSPFGKVSTLEKVSLPGLFCADKYYCMGRY